MAQYLSQEWQDDYKKLFNETQPPRPGVSARMQYVATGPDGDITYHWIIEDGVLTQAQVGPLEDAEVTMTMTLADAVAVQKGEMDPTGAFMQGKLKAAGDMAKLMSLMPLTNSVEYKTLQDQVRDITEF